MKTQHSRLWLSTGCVLVVLAVMAGAIGSHMVEEGSAQKSFETAATYHLYASLAIVVGAITSMLWQSKLWLVSFILALAGIIFFSGSLYIKSLAISETAPLGPFGGICIMASWAMLALAGIRGARVKE
jgi:uncharacterized membrane protein YgdD (TMEM256/DUF423 family)